MPELPEVETIARALREGGREGDPISGKTILHVQILWERSIALPSPMELYGRLVGQTVQTVSRRAKYVQIILDHGVLLIHLRMSGDLRVEKAFDYEEIDFPLRPHDRVVITFTDGIRLVFNDPRKFGRMWLVDNPGEITDKVGPEPLDPEFTPAQFAIQLNKSHRQLKPLLLDQSFLAGLGNIYTDEALNLAKLSPTRAANTLSASESERLLESIRYVLREGIQRNGASIDWVYRGGNYQHQFRVYRRTGEPCMVCGTPIQRKVIGQRSTHFCPKCQPEHPENQ